MDLTRLKIGTEDWRPVYWKDRYTHCLLVGKSGTGKSSLLANWWREDCIWKTAKVLIEPSGFLAQDCYSISKGKSLYCSLKTPVSINPMQAPYDPNIICDIVAEALNQVITVTTPNERLTVKMRGILDQSVKHCLEKNRKSLVNVLDKIVNMKGNDTTRDGIIARLNFLLNDDRMKEIICGNDTVQWGEFIQKGKSFILDCFGMSKEKMVFSGSLVSQAIKNYFRYERPSKYKPLAMFIDEAHNFVNSNFTDILKEGRKYKLSCVLSTQDFAFIPKEMARVMVSAGTIVAFRLAHNESRIIANELDFLHQTIQFTEKYYVSYLTPEGRGMAKAPRPPYFKKLEPKVAPKKETSFWFPLECHQPAGTPI